MMTWMKILAVMLFLQAPGKSIYSTVTTTEDGPASVTSNVNGSTAYRLLLPGDEVPTQCAQPGNVACYKPRKRDVILQLRPIKTEWQRTETYDEGVKRYAVIAKAMAEVLKEGTWVFPVSQSWKYLVVIAFHESGFRRDIHIGLGSMAIGDCKWRSTKWDEHGFVTKQKRVPGTCKSHGPYQTLFKNPTATEIYGFGARDVVGDDLEHTKNATLIATKHIDRLHKYCANWGPRPYSACIFAGYGGNISVSDPRIVARVKSYNKLRSAPTVLDPYVTELLKLKSTTAKAVSDREK